MLPFPSSELGFFFRLSFPYLVLFREGVVSLSRRVMREMRDSPLPWCQGSSSGLATLSPFETSESLGRGLVSPSLLSCVSSSPSQVYFLFCTRWRLNGFPPLFLIQALPSPTGSFGFLSNKVFCLCFPQSFLLPPKGLHHFSARCSAIPIGRDFLFSSPL